MHDEKNWMDYRVLEMEELIDTRTYLFDDRSDWEARAEWFVSERFVRFYLGIEEYSFWNHYDGSN